MADTSLVYRLVGRNSDHELSLVRNRSTALVIPEEAVVPLDEASLLDQAMRNTGLSDFGGEECPQGLHFQTDPQGQ